MAKIAVRYPVEAAVFHTPRLSPVRDCEPEEARNTFIADLAERIAAVCVEPRPAGANDMARAVPLFREASADQALTTAPDSPDFSLFTPDGKHLRTLGEIEADVLRLALSHYRGRISEVARRLNIGRSTVYRKLDEFGIPNSGQ